MPRGRTKRKRLDLQGGSRRNVVRRPGLKEALRQADRVARTRANRRIARRKGMRTVQASLELPMPAEEGGDLTAWKRTSRILVALFVLIPLCLVTSITLFQQVSEPHFTSKFWKTPEFFSFAVGGVYCICWFFIGFTKKALLYLYVLGHELTHVLFIYLSLGKVSGFQVGLDGGYVITNKSTVLIALSPYFVPFWSLVAMLILIPVGHFFPFDYYNQTLFGVLGATWVFHFLFTVWMIPRDQPDLKENDTFFSFMLILLANIILLSLLICVASPDLGWRHFVYNWVNNSRDLLWEPLLNEMREATAYLRSVA